MLRHVERVSARPGHLLASLQLPAFVEGRHFDVLALRPVRNWVDDPYVTLDIYPLPPDQS
ncbi:hypothetical protein OG444_08665 [Streptomyces sp. NBC_01232]|nr:hypothetical protein OG444_08665 [Streptomyces sp. NBC_01232]